MRVCVNGKYSKRKKLTCSVPQGSTSRAKIFISYYSVIDEIIAQSLTPNGFADDHSLKKDFHANKKQGERATIKALETKLLVIKSWMTSMQLKLNGDKT